MCSGAMVGIFTVQETDPIGIYAGGIPASGCGCFALGLYERERTTLAMIADARQ